MYRAKGTRLPRGVAIKASAQRFSERFAGETQIIASLNHPNISGGRELGSRIESVTLETQLGPRGLIQEVSMKLHATVAVAALVVGLVVSAAAQQPQDKTLTAIGPVLKISGDSLVIDVGKGKTMQFVTNSDTLVKVSTGGAQAQAARAEGKKGLKITEVVHEGDQVFVRYSSASGKMVASEVDVRERRPQSAQPVK